MKDSGFTLLEILIALAIIGTTVTVVLDTVNYQTTILYENILTTEMYQLAKEKMTFLEEEPQSSKGKIEDTGYTYENTASRLEGGNIIELETRVNGHGKEVVLKRLTVE